MKKPLQPTHSNSGGDEYEVKLPWRANLAIKDIIHPLVVSRVGLFKIVIVFFAILLTGVLIWVEYFRPPSGHAIVKQMVDAAGGMNAWQGIKYGKFKRTHKVYDEMGKVVKSEEQFFYFRNTDHGPQLLVQSRYPNGDNVYIGRDINGYWATVNGIFASAVQKAREQEMMCESDFCTPLCGAEMAFYRFSMPFKLTDPGVIAKYEGEKILNGKKVMLVDVTYDPKVGKDRWVFYVDSRQKLIQKIEHYGNAEVAAQPEEIYLSDFRKEFGINFSHKNTYYRSNGKVLEEYTISEVDFSTPLSNTFFSRDMHATAKANPDLISGR